MSTTTLFGAPLGYTAMTLSAWIEALEQRWLDFSAGVNPSELSSDLSKLRPIFGHGAVGSRLRTAFSQLHEHASGVDLPSEVILTSGGLDLITPEGRILLDVLYRLRTRGQFVIDVDMQARSLALAVETRADWFEHWALKQVAGSLSLPPIAAALLILINGSTAPALGFYLPDDEAVSPDYEATVIQLIGDFSEMLGGRRPATGPLRNHWAFTQATRVLSRDLQRVPSQEGARVQVREGRESHLLDDLRGRLARQPPAKLRRAVLALVEQYGRHRGLFASIGGSNERSSHTKWVVESLLGSGTE